AADWASFLRSAWSSGPRFTGPPGGRATASGVQSSARVLTSYALLAASSRRRSASIPAIASAIGGVLGDAWAPERGTGRATLEHPHPEPAAAPVRASRPFSLDASSPPLRRALPGPRSVAWAARAMQATMRRGFIGAAEPVGRPRTADPRGRRG